MATIRSIAEAANVSRGTVDKVLNNRPGVSQEVRDKIKRIAEELGYKPNLAGKALAFQKKDIRIGIVVPSAADPFFLEVFEGIKAGINEFSHFGIAFEVLEMTVNSVAEQQSCIQQLIEKKVSGIVISPFDDNQIRDAMLLVKDLGIPVVTFNSDLSGIGRMCYVGQDSKRSGRVAGDLMHKLLPNGGQIVCINGPGVFKSLGERLSGFRSYLKSECPNLTIAAVLNNNNNSELSYQLTREYLSSGKPVDGFFITGHGIDGMVRAIQQHGRPGIRVICYDMIPTTRQLFLEGLVDFSLLQEPRMQGYRPIQILVDMLFFGQKIAEKNQFTRIDSRTKESMD